MVSPRKDLIDVENRVNFGIGSISGIKSNLLVKPTYQPLGDVRNTLGSARKLSEEVSKNTKKDSELKPWKCKPEPVSVLQEEVEEPLDSVWDAPLAYNNVYEDCYCDIIPLSLQLTDEDISRFVLNKPRPRSEVTVYKWRDDDSFLPSPEITETFCTDLYCDSLCYDNGMGSDDELPEVPPFSDSDDSFLDEEF